MSGETETRVEDSALGIAERHNALIYARRHLKTHCEWREYLKRGGELPCEEVGDLEHHEQAITELNLICKVLRRAAQEDSDGD